MAMAEQQLNPNDPRRQAWVTLATNDSYALGTLVLGSSLRRTRATFERVVMVTPEVSSHMRSVLETVFNSVIEVNVLDSGDSVNLALLSRPELGITFTKLNCWRLVEYSKCVFLDADTMVLSNCDELFERSELSAAPVPGRPDCFNSGVFVFQPKEETYRNLLDFAISAGSFDGGDQGLLNSFFKGWRNTGGQLPFVYNMDSSGTSSNLPAFEAFSGNVKIVHFIGALKPWLMTLGGTGQVCPPGGQEHLQPFLQAWWDLFRAEVHPNLGPELEYGQVERIAESRTIMDQITSGVVDLSISASHHDELPFLLPPHPPPQLTLRSESHLQIAVSSALSVHYSTSGQGNPSSGLVGIPDFSVLKVTDYVDLMTNVLVKNGITMAKLHELFVFLKIKLLTWDELERKANIHGYGAFYVCEKILHSFDVEGGKVNEILIILDQLELKNPKNEIQHKIREMIQN